MSNTYATPLSLEVGPSRRVQGFLLLIHCLALVSVLLLPWPWWLRLCLGGLLGGLYWYGRRRYARHYRLTWNEQGWQVEHGDIAADAALLPSSFVTPWLTILNFRCDASTRLSVLLLEDAVDAEAFRRLRVRLRVTGQAAVGHARMNT